MNNVTFYEQLQNIIQDLHEKKKCELKCLVMINKNVNNNWKIII